MDTLNIWIRLYLIKGVIIMSIGVQIIIIKYSKLAI